MEWFVGICGDKCDLEDLAESLNSSELCITKDRENFVLKSTEFEILDDESEVEHKARELLSLINGAATLLLDMPKPLTMGGVVRVKDDGRREIFVSASSSVTVRSRVSLSLVQTNGSVKEVGKANPWILSWVRIGRNDRSVFDVLRRFGEGTLTWGDLYRILEIILADVGGLDSIAKKGWATKKAIRLFRHTACSPTAIGDEARHGTQKTKPPREPIPFSEAKALIKTIIHNWLRSKGKKT